MRPPSTLPLDQQATMPGNALYTDINRNVVAISDSGCS